MKILFVCHRFPFPPKRGGKIRPFNMIRHLNKSHEVTVASLARNEEEARAGRGLKDYCNGYLLETVTPFMAISHMIECFVKRKPLSMGYFHSQRLKKRILKEMSLHDYDLIIVHCSSVAPYVEDIHGIPKLLDFGDMDSQKWLIYSKFKKFPSNLIYLLEGKRLQKAECLLAGKFNYCTCTTRKELETLMGYGVNVQADWIPNGVDFDYFYPSNTEYEDGTICFVGRMDYYPNQQGILDFCKNTLPLIRSEYPKVKLIIIGANPSNSIQKLGKDPAITVTGTVEDVRPYVWRAAVNIVPLNIARGTQNKILEALAMGVPTVTSVQAAGGVDAIPGEHFLVASNHTEFAKAVLRLLCNPDERRRFSKLGRQRMLEKHDWRRSMEKLDGILRKCIETSGAIS